MLMKVIRGIWYGSIVASGTVLVALLYRVLE